jgi:hypothetical protein
MSTFQSNYEEVSSSSSTSTTNSNIQSPMNINPSKQKLSPPNNRIDIIIVTILLHILAENKKSKDYYKKMNSNKDGHFTIQMKPSISLLGYLRRIIKYVKMEFSTLIISMIYIDRICKEKVFLNEYNIHRIMLIAIYIAYMYNEDCIYDNKYLALVSGISKSEMILLEQEFLELIDFQLYVSEDLFKQYKNCLNKNTEEINFCEIKIPSLL